MVYLITNNEQLINSTSYPIKSVKECLLELQIFDELQFDSETDGRDPHICDILCIQFGTPDGQTQYVIDIKTVDILLFKDLLETKLLIGHNIKFDIQFLFKYNIIPTRVWDTMVIEQLLHLGYNNKYFRYALNAVAQRYLGIDIDKSIRGEIIWRGLDDDVIKYAAGDVQCLSEIKRQEEYQCNVNKCRGAQRLENAFVIVMAYLEWCGIKLDVDKWRAKMEKNQQLMDEYKQQLDDFVVNNNMKEFIDYTLFGNYSKVNWNSEKQTIPLIEQLGFNCLVEDKTNGGLKKSVEAKNLKKQKGVNDIFLNIYIKYKEAQKDLSTYGDKYIDSINPITGRLHTTFYQLGADSGRMSCGSTRSNEDVAKAKHLSPSKCSYPQLQNLPSDEETRSAFIAEEGNLFCSCDYSALESRLGADIYQEPSMIEEFMERSGDIHSLVAHHCFKKELENIPIEKIKELRPDLRKKAKGVGFSQQFGGSAKAIQNSLGCTLAEAKEIAEAYNSGFKGIASFKEQGAKHVRANGYILLCKYTGHKTYWEDFKKWKAIEDDIDKGLKSMYSSDQIKEHNMAISKWERKALNSVTQGTGIIILKYAMILFFKWIVESGYFNKILICDLVHDEACVEFPKELVNIVPNKLKECMEKSSSRFCKSLPIPAVPETGSHWIH